MTQVEKALERFERLKRRIDEDSIWAKLDEEETTTLRTGLITGGWFTPSARPPQPPDDRLTLRGWFARGAALRSPTASACKTRRVSAQPRRGDQVARRGHRLCRVHETLLACSTSTITFARSSVRACRLPREGKDTGEKVGLFGSFGDGCGRHAPNVVYVKEHPGTLLIDEKESVCDAPRIRTGKRLVYA